MDMERTYDDTNPLFYYHNISYWSNGDTQSFMGGGIHVSYIKGAYVEFYLKRAYVS